MGEMATPKEHLDSAEIQFAQRLASNRKPVRDKALKKLQKWLEAKSSSQNDAFSESDFIKIWKGLHYCLWMQDKPLLQEELTERITQMIHVFGSVESSLLFVKVFFLTEAREWDVLDKWRVDKFMTLVRRMLHQTLLFLKNMNWQTNILTEFTNILSCNVMSPDNEAIPQGLRIHLADIYLSELEKIGAEQLTAEQVLTFLEPIFQYLPGAVNTDVMKRVFARVFGAILEQTLDDALEAAKKLMEKEEEGSEENADDLDMPVRLQFDYSAIADRLFQLGSDKLCRTKNRTILYEWVKRFRELDQGIITKEEYIAPGISKRLHKKKKKTKTRKRKGNSTSTDSFDAEGEITPIKKHKSEAGSEMDENSEGKEKKNKKLGSADGEPNQNVKTKDIKKKKKTKQNITEKVLYDSCDDEGSSVLNELQNDCTDTESSGKEKKVAHIESNTNAVKKKRSAKCADLRDSCDLFTGTSSSDLSALPATLDNTTEKGSETQEEIEIWIPNKKYKGKTKSPLDLSGKELPGSKFAKFDTSISTPPAFLRKAVAKATPKSDKKKLDPATMSPVLSPPDGRKHVSFNMNKNQAKEFNKKTLIESKEVAFNPDRTPDQSILKSPPTTRSMTLKRNMTSRSSKRAKATDFF